MRDDEVTLSPEQRERVRAWILALESGNYEQCQDGLHKPDAFCCLGVACDVMDPNQWSSFDGEGLADYGERDPESGEYEALVLPAFVKEWYGLEGTDPALTGIAKKDGFDPYAKSKSNYFKAGDVVTMHASRWNDQQGATFHEIAQMLRAKYLIMD